MKKDIINKILLIASGVLLLIASVFLIVLSNLKHGKVYIYENVAFERNEETYQNELVNEKIIITFKEDNKFTLDYYANDKHEIYEFLYKELEGNYIDVINIKSTTKERMYIDAFKMKEYNILEDINVPSEYVFICETNTNLRLTLIVLIIVNGLVFVVESIYHLIDFINWKIYLNKMQKKESNNI